MEVNFILQYIHTGYTHGGKLYLTIHPYSIYSWIYHHFKGIFIKLRENSPFRKISPLEFNSTSIINLNLNAGEIFSSYSQVKLGTLFTWNMKNNHYSRGNPLNFSPFYLPILFYFLDFFLYSLFRNRAKAEFKDFKTQLKFETQLK